MQQTVPEDDTLKLSVAQAPVVRLDTVGLVQTSTGWLEAFKQVLPIYIATHIVFLALTYLATLFKLGNFSGRALPLPILLSSWSRWDSSQFTYIATHGYDAFYRMAFFPLFPLLERGLAMVVGDPFVAGLLISNVATLGMFMVLYRLVAEDFGAEHAWRSVLYLAVFPTAFFFAVAYNESLFLCFALLSFYYMRKGYWWLAGLAALFASLTRSIAICLLVPFAYEYFRQRDFQWRRIGLSVLSCLGILGGVVIFAIYGYLTFHDPLAFSHAQTGGDWQRHLVFPWVVFLKAYSIIKHNPILTFQSIHTVMDLSAILFILAILILIFVGPWKLAREYWCYAFYAVAIYLFVILVPEGGGLPLASLGRFMLEIFPAFVMLSVIGQQRNFNVYYLCISSSLLAFLLLQWLTGGWIV
ncbi:MAG TPA: glycosyltransferase family 39 protein [Ktedonobacteraceae bacterium]|nr:glycosyltransferase family 39 protein [Ktedonobacteraceae bacterium]